MHRVRIDVPGHDVRLASIALHLACGSRVVDRIDQVKNLHRFVAEPEAHRESMSYQASYLTHQNVARDPLDWNPEFSRRARGFASYAALRELGRIGLQEMVERNCDCAAAIVNGLRKDGVLTTKPFQNPIDFVYFDFWHYDGRTAKHGALMGGADFVQWHGNYPMLKKLVDLHAMADDLRKKR